MTLIRTSIFAVVFALALSAQFGPGRRAPRSAGQDQGPPPARAGQLGTFLELTDAQLESIAQIQKDYRAAVRENLQSIADKRRQANESLGSDSPDATLIGQLLVQAKQLEESVKSREGEFVAQTQAVLTDAQKTKLATLEPMVPYQSEIREAEGLGLLAGEDGEFHFHAGGPMGPRGPEGPPFGGPGFGRP